MQKPWISHTRADASRLFGLLLREDSHGKSDVVAAAPWFSKLGKDPIEFTSDQLKAILGGSGLMMLSRVVALAESDPFLIAMNEMVRIEHGLRELVDVDLAGVQIRRGFIITSSAPARRRSIAG